MKNLRVTLPADRNARHTIPLEDALQPLASPFLFGREGMVAIGIDGRYVTFRVGVKGRKKGDMFAFRGIVSFERGGRSYFWQDETAEGQWPGTRFDTWEDGLAVLYRLLDELCTALSADFLLLKDSIGDIRAQLP